MSSEESFVLNDFVSPTTAVGSVVLAIIASIVVGLAQRYRVPLIRVVQDFARTRPQLRNALRWGADRLYPGWRSDAKLPRTNYGIEWRIRELRKLKRRRFVIVGGIYLDLALTPIDVNRLDDQEFNDLDTVRMECGGSGCYVGRYLYEHYRQRSVLFSRIGSGDRFSVALLKLLNQEHWIREQELTFAPDAQCGVSVHLIQRDRTFYTTFTHMGALNSFEWQPILGKLDRKTRTGGVLYISGYFRTNLCLNLCRTLRELSPKLLVCVDHGRFRAGDNRNAEMALVDAFREQLVDVYICTYDEICELMRTTGLVVDGSLGLKETLELFGRERVLPPITVVRSNTLERKASAFMLFQGRATGVEGIVRRPGFDARIGPKNVFNAAFVHALVTGPPESDLQETLRHAMSQALGVWADPTKETKVAAERVLRS